MGGCTFADCADLKSVYIPSTVTEIAMDCFVGCPAKITVSPDNPVSKSVDGQLVLMEETEP